MARGNNSRFIPVPGDLMLLAARNFIPTAACLIDAANGKIDFFSKNEV